MTDKERLDWLERCWVRVQAGSGAEPIYLDASPPRWPFHNDNIQRDWLKTKPGDMSLRMQIDLAAKRMPSP